MEEGLEAPRRRKKNPSGSKQKQTVTDVVLIKSILVVGAVFAVIGGIFFFDWRDLGVAVGMDRSPEKLLADLKYYQKKQLNLIASFQDKEQAKAAVPQLNEIGKQLAKITYEYDEWDLTEDEDEIRAYQNLPPEVHERNAEIGQEFSQLHFKHESLIQDVIKKLKGEARLSQYVNHIYMHAKVVGIRYVEELKKEKADQGVPEADRRDQETWQRPSGAPRRIQGTPQRPGGGGMGRPVISSPPSKRVPSDRSF